MTYFDDLKERHRQVRDGHPESLSLRVHRSLSWLHNAETHANDDKDSTFIFYWIAFNAAYSCDVENDSRPGEQRSFTEFLQRLVSLDHEHRLEAAKTQRPPSVPAVRTGKRPARPRKRPPRGEPKKRR